MLIIPGFVSFFYAGFDLTNWSPDISIGSVAPIMYFMLGFKRNVASVLW